MNSEQDRLQNLLLKFGSQPKRSATFFLVGLISFFAFMIGLYLTREWQWLQLTSFVFMLISVLFSLYGYIGIVANRLAQFRHNSYKNKIKYKHLS